MFFSSPQNKESSRPIYSRAGRQSINGDSAQDKVRQLYDFLDTIEGKAESLKSTHAFIENELKDIQDNEQKVMQDYSENRSKFMNMKFELEEAKKSNELLKKMLEKEKAKNKELEVNFQKQEEARLKEQKEEFEEMIKKHLDFIDQLVNDKKDLAEQCEKLMNQLKENETKYHKQASALKEKHQRELQNSKEIWAASEKQKREKWMKEKTTEIKEITIKGLEPELDRIMNKGKEEVKKVEEKYRTEISHLREEMYWEYEEKLKAYKEKTLRESDEKIEKEREYMEEKMKEKLEKMEQKFSEEKEKMKSLYENRIEELEKEKRKEIIQLKEKIRKLDKNT